MRRELLILIGLAAAGLAAGQGYRFHEILDGKAIPAVVKPRDLPADFYAVKIVMTGELNFLDLYGPLAFGGGFDSQGGSLERQRAREVLAVAAGVYWTQGERTTVEGRDFLIAYRLDIPVSSLAGGGRSFDHWAMENPMELALQLIRPDAIGRLSPIPSLSPEKMAKAIETFERALAEETGLPVGTRVAGTANMAARQTAALSNVKQIALGIMLYGSDYDDRFPKTPSIANLRKAVEPYLKNASIWSTGNPNRSEFLFNPMLYGHSATDVPSPAEWPMVYESRAWPDGRRVVGYVDGHAKLVTGAEWTRLEGYLKRKVPSSKPPPPPKKKKPG